MIPSSSSSSRISIFSPVAGCLSQKQYLEINNVMFQTNKTKKLHTHTWRQNLHEDKMHSWSIRQKKSLNYAININTNKEKEIFEMKVEINKCICKQLTVNIERKENKGAAILKKKKKTWEKRRIKSRWKLQTGKVRVK